MSPIQDLKQLLATAEGPTRKELLAELHEIIVSVEEPEETATRVSLYPLQTAAARIGQDLGIFQTLAHSGPQAFKALAEQTKAHPQTLKRLLRYMAGVGMIEELEAGCYASSKTCQNLSDTRAIATVTHFWENCCPLFQEMPSFLRRKRYEDVTNGRDTIFQEAYRTNLDTYSWMAEHDLNEQALINWMGFQSPLRSRPLDQYPFEQETRSWDRDQPVFVDVGGNVGHYCAMFKSRYPTIPGKVILQDSPSTIAHAIKTPGVEKMGHDLFQEQPIRGAKYYHLGWILHNWNDKDACRILCRIKDAMSAESLILINDIVLPETKVPPFAAALDLVMMSACAGRERTREEWNGLFANVGLKARKWISYMPEQCQTLICVELA